MKPGLPNNNRAARWLRAISLVVVMGATASVPFTTKLKADVNRHAGSAEPAASDLVGQDRGLIMPMINPARGRTLFASKGCVVCHSVNGIGGEDARPLDASTMEPFMNPFEFTARMWRGAEAMIAFQRDELGEQIFFTGAEIADIIAFLHDPEEQRRFSEDDIPETIRELIEHDD